MPRRFSVKGATVTLLALFGVLCAGFASAEVSLVDYYGAAWETGGFPPSNLGDFFFVVGFVDGVDTSILTWDPVSREYTIYLTDFASQGQIDLGGGNLLVYYDNGRVVMYEDPARNGNFGTGTPPNATSPWTFIDGSTYLSGVFNNFELNYDSVFLLGAYQGYFDFVGGSHLGELGSQTAGYTFAGLAGPGMGPVPPGYNLWVDGEIYLVVTPVQKNSWGGIKTLYR
jgi:hypothetical protein